MEKARGSRLFGTPIIRFQNDQDVLHRFHACILRGALYVDSRVSGATLTALPNWCLTNLQNVIKDLRQENIDKLTAVFAHGCRKLRRYPIRDRVINWKGCDTTFMIWNCSCKLTENNLSTMRLHADSLSQIHTTFFEFLSALLGESPQCIPNGKTFAYDPFWASKLSSGANPPTISVETFARGRHVEVDWFARDALNYIAVPVGQSISKLTQEGETIGRMLKAKECYFVALSVSSDF
jgi:hypothetical protein